MPNSSLSQDEYENYHRDLRYRISKAVRNDKDVEKYFRSFRDETADFLVEDTKNYIRSNPLLLVYLEAYALACGYPTYTVEIHDCYTGRLLTRFYDYDAD